MNKKKWLSAVLTGTMILGAMSYTAMADEENYTENGIYYRENVTRTISGFDQQSHPKCTYFCANGLPIVISDPTDSAMGAKITWTYDGAEYSKEISKDSVVCGGGWNIPVVSTSITMDGGDIEWGIFGGGVQESATVTDSVDIVIKDGKLNDGVVGGGIRGAIGTAEKSASINVTVGEEGEENADKPVIAQNIIGGGFYGNVYGDISLTINNVSNDFNGAGSNTFNCGSGVYGEHHGDTKVVMNGGTINGILAGGAMLDGNVYGNTEVIMNGGCVDDLAGGSAGYNRSMSGGKIIGNTKVIVNDGTVLETVGGGSGYYGGEIEGDTEVIINGGTIGSDKELSGHTYGIYGGSVSGAKVSGTTKVTVNNGKIKTSVVSNKGVYVNETANGSIGSGSVEISENAEFKPIVKVNEVYSTKPLEEVFESVEDGDIVTLLDDITFAGPLNIDKSITIDGGNHTLTSTTGRNICVAASGVNVTLRNLKAGTTGHTNGDSRTVQINSPFTGVVLTLDNCEITSDIYAVNVVSSQDNTVNIINNSTVKGYAAVQICGENITVNVEDSTLIGENIYDGESNGYGVVVFNAYVDGGNYVGTTNSTVNITNSTIRAIQNGTSEQSVVLYHVANSGNKFNITGENTFVTFPDGLFEVNNNAKDQNNVTAISGGSFSSDVSEYVVPGFTAVKDGENWVVGEQALELKATLKETSDESVYDLYVSVVGENQVINRLTSAEFTFELNTTKGEIGYEVSGIPNVNITVDPANENRYLFNFDGVDEQSATGVEIKIGQVKFTGYGEFTFGAVGDDNKVNTTTLSDNIVNTYVTNPVKANEGKLTIDAPINVTLAPATHKLTINITFPNAIEDQDAAYQNMKVVISGGDLAENLEYALGTGEKATALNNGAYVLEVADTLTENTAYTVTVSGAGYRTARYTVTMTGDKILNFWNNVKDTPAVVEVGKNASA